MTVSLEEYLVVPHDSKSDLPLKRSHFNVYMYVDSLNEVILSFKKNYWIFVFCIKVA